MTQNKKYIVALGVAIAIYIIMDSKKNLGKITYSQISDKLADYIAKFEGYVSKAQWDSAQWSIGHGEGWNWDKNRKVQQGDVIDRPTAKRWLIKSTEKFFNGVDSVVKVPVSENQMIAMVSLAYNIGLGAAGGKSGFRNSQLLKDLNAGKSKSEVAKGFAVYNKAKDNKTGVLRVWDALTNRRTKEAAKFMA
jgi:GH24 family phage-related lysozyme (muramidase)